MKFLVTHPVTEYINGYIYRLTERIFRSNAFPRYIISCSVSR